MRIRITPSLVISVIALFIALGGVANATVDLPWNSVGKEQLKWGAVDSSKVENHSLKALDFAQGQLPRGEQGPKGERGAKGATGETGARGPAGAATGGATGLTLKDAAGTVLGTVVGGANAPFTMFVVLRDGGLFNYNDDGTLRVSDNVIFLTPDCTGTAYFYNGSGWDPDTNAAEIDRLQGQNRWVIPVPGSSVPSGVTAPLAFKATRNVRPIGAVEPVYWDGYGPCEEKRLDRPAVVLALDQVPAPPVAQSPLSVS